MEILNLLNLQLVTTLSETLAKIDQNWWQSLVVEKLTFPQKIHAQNLPVNAIDQLDMSSLLRIADQNWYELSSQLNLNTNVRNWLKEMQSIRNRWAHAPAGGIPEDIKYRDIDTTARLLEAFGANSEILKIISDEKRISLKKMASAESTNQESKENSPLSCTFKPTQVIKLKVDPSKKGVIVKVLEDLGECRYQVFHDNNLAIFYESQIELADENGRLTAELGMLHATLTALQLIHPSTAYLYSLCSSRINFVPYQFRPVLKLINSDRPRMLIADEVGVGKTIEAGLILKELQARHDVKSVLIICPKPLVAEHKWQEEMKRFDERFEHLDSNALRYCIDETSLDGVWPRRYSRAIVPYSLFDETLLIGDNTRNQLGLLDLRPPPAFDLVIVDEAHTIKNTDTWAYRVTRQFCDNAEAVILLSATPIQLETKDLYNLLHLIRPDVIASYQDFQQMAEPNPHLNQAIETVRSAKNDWESSAKSQIEAALKTSWGRGVIARIPKMQQTYDAISNQDNSPEERLKIVRNLEELYTFSPFINRTRRRDIGNFTTRKPETIAVDFTPEQQYLHQNLLDLVGKILARKHGDSNLFFMLSTLRRQIASCVFGLAPFLESILKRHITQLELSELDEESASETISDLLSEFRSDVDKLIAQAKSIKGPDPKLEAFLIIIKDKQKLENNKLLVFSGFRHTLAYLIEKLNNKNVRFGLIHGDIHDRDRRELRNRFSLKREDPRALDVLLLSEVGCEGLDYQFCDAMVNYDLPWNPMRVEQRIGRIDRYGQNSETAVIYNLITPGTVDAEIYDRCLLRIGIFRESIGGSEEILGEITREIKNIAENFSLTPEEQANRLQQLADNGIRIIHEQEELEQQQSKLFGLSQLNFENELVSKASCFWLKPNKLANLIKLYLQHLGAENISLPITEKPIVTVQLNKDLRDAILIDLKKLKTDGEMTQSWSRWLNGNDPHLTMTFNQETAAEQRDIFFITPNHPLAQQAAKFVKTHEILECNLKYISQEVPPGRYTFAIYRWRKIGVKEDFTFQPISSCPTLNPKILEILEYSEPLTGEFSPISPKEEIDLEKVHYQIWIDERAQHIEQTQQAAKSRLDSLSTSHIARIALLEEQRENVIEQKIRRMRDSQIESANREYNQRSKQLEEASKQADLLAGAMVFGVIEIQG